MIYVLIPARGGSKSIKDKNIVKIKKKELIYFTIQTAKKLKKITKIVVSTDSKKIAKVAKLYGAEVPFIRPKKYSKDNSTDLQVFKHYINWLKKNNMTIPKIIIHLRVTTPFRNTNIVNKAINIILKNKNISSLRSMRKSIFSPYKMWFVENKKAIPVLKNKKKELHSASRQSLKSSYDHIGYVDILRVKKTIYKNSMVGKNVYPFLLNVAQLKKYIDIDTKYDLRMARKYF
jgi:N-acylneuraminate cytidylyltransferase